MKRLVLMVIPALICGAILTSCTENDADTKEFIVSFDSNGGGEVLPQTVREGEKAVKPEIDPTLNGYTYVAWYKEVELTTEWKFDTDIVTADITLYAEWIEDTDKEEPECDECDEFCLCANVEDFYKTAPFINAYLENLSKNNLNDEQKLQSLIEWLNLQPCIISAKLEPENIPTSSGLNTKSTPIQPPRGTIAILLDENGTTKDLFLEVGPAYPYMSDLWVATNYRYMKPREVRVITQPLSPTSMVFDFINSFDFEVLSLGFIYYSSTTHSRDDILSNLSKPYITGVEIAWPTGTQIFISPTFHSMENRNYQADWLQFMAAYHLFETNPFEPSGAVITFLVPRGQEREWAAKFLANYEFVNSTGVNYGYRSMIIR